MKFMFALTAFNVLISCINSSAQEDKTNSLKRRSTAFQYFVNENMVYGKDSRTNLCFAGMGDEYMTNSRLSNVPCSSEVERLIEK